MRTVAEVAQEQLNVSCEVIDLQTLLPFDEETVVNVGFVLPSFSAWKIHSCCAIHYAGFPLGFVVCKELFYSSNSV